MSAAAAGKAASKAAGAAEASGGFRMKAMDFFGGGKGTGGSEGATRNLIRFVVAIFVIGLIVWLVRKFTGGGNETDKYLDDPVGGESDLIKDGNIVRDCNDFEYTCDTSCNSMIQNKQGKYCCMRSCK